MHFDSPAGMRRVTVLVFLTFLTYSAYRLISANEIGLLLFKQLVPTSFYALFVIQMLYYVVWYGQERRKKSGDSVEAVETYQRLKQQIKVLALVQGMIFLGLYLGTTIAASH